ncbi:MAG: hypothetical protein QXF78_04220 [Pyrobaculum sp.]
MDLTKWYLGLVPYVETYLSTTPNAEATASYGGELCGTAYGSLAVQSIC